MNNTKIVRKCKNVIVLIVNPKILDNDAGQEMVTIYRFNKKRQYRCRDKIAHRKTLNDLDILFIDIMSSCTKIDSCPLIVVHKVYNGLKLGMK